MQLSNHAQSEAMHATLAHQLQQFYKALWVPSITWTASVMRYTHHKLANAKLLIYPSIYRFNV